MNNEAVFYKRAEEWLYWFLELNPELATDMGDHRWDNQLKNNSAKAIEEQYQEMLVALADFEEMDASCFSLDTRIDHTLIVHILRAIIREHEKVRGYQRDPGNYLNQVMYGVYALIIKEFAPLPERLKSVLSRMREIPRVLQEGRANIVPAEVPYVWCEIALEQAKQAPGLFLSLLPSTAAQAAPEFEGELKKVGQLAVQEIQTYAEFLEKEVLPKAAGDFAVGRELFDEILREDHMVDYDADELLETGWRLFHETEEQMKALVAEIDPDKSVQELLEEAKSDHPTVDGLLRAYEDEMNATRQYVIDHEIATIPEGEILRIIETPGYLCPLIPYAAYIPPGILDEKQEGIFLVTPVDTDAPKELQKEKLKGQNNNKLPVVALHEGYPGHHLQFVWANQQESIPRRMGAFLSSLFIEGWAFYCEELMEQLGYIAKPLQRLGRLADQLWRAARIILDVSLHTRGMSVEEAVDFLTKKCQLEQSNALSEVRRYTSSPTQPQSYLMGKLAILELVEEYKRLNPGVSIRELNDAILGQGPLPPRLMRQKLLGS